MAIKMNVPCSSLQSTWQSSLQRRCLVLNTWLNWFASYWFQCRALWGLCSFDVREHHLVCFSVLVAVTWPLPAQCFQNCYDVGHKRSGLLRIAMAGSSAKPAEKVSLWCSDSKLRVLSKFGSCALWGFHLFPSPSMLIFSSAWCKTPWDLPVLRTGMIFPSQLPGVAFQPPACHCKVSCHAALWWPTFRSSLWDVFVQTRL